MSTLLNNICDVIAYGFYPCMITFPKIKKDTLFDKPLDYFYKPYKYENELFKFEIKDNKFIYEILNNIEPETNLKSEFIDNTKCYTFDIIDNKIFTNGNINYRHLLMLNDFTDLNLELNLMSDDEFISYKKNILDKISEYIDEENKLIEIIKQVFDKTVSHKYDFNLIVKEAPAYNSNLIDMEGYRKSRNPAQEIKDIQDRYWITRDSYVSPSVQIFILMSQYYKCLMDNKLYYINIYELESWGKTYKLNPYDLLFKYEGGLNFYHCKYTYWNKLLQNLPKNTLYYRNFTYFELIGHNEYKGLYIPIHELIIFCNILNKEGASITYNLKKLNNKH